MKYALLYHPLYELDCSLHYNVHVVRLFCGSGSISKTLIILYRRTLNCHTRHCIHKNKSNGVHTIMVPVHDSTVTMPMMGWLSNEAMTQYIMMMDMTSCRFACYRWHRNVQYSLEGNHHGSSMTVAWI